MPTGQYQRKPRVARILIVCEVCGAQRAFLPAQLAQRSGRFCSHKCAASMTVKPGRMVELECPVCASRFLKRHDHLRERNYCSRACVHAARRIEGAKWRDPAQIREYMRGYVAANRQRHNERGRNWAQNNADKKRATNRRRRAAGDLSPEQWGAILSEFGGSCVACGATNRIEVDHVIPVALGGTNDPENIQPLCRSCNASKGARAIDYRPMRRLLRALYDIEINEVAA